jgi:UDP-N-acetylmuramoyl-tripeptide--D-alanyl-D-alanine ligase
VKWFAFVVLVLSLGPAGLRWLRVAQREHYLAGSVVRFARRWWTVRPDNIVLATIGVVGFVLSTWWPLAALATAVAVIVGPLGLSPRGRTSALVLTRRLKTLGAVWLLLQVIVLVVGVVVGAPAVFAALGGLLAPALVDAALYITAPYEDRLAGAFVRTAATRLREIGPDVVAITGSYGKTSTKNHVAHLVAGARRVVATPASFNNRAGLARAVNENLAPGTEVFVAEMGTYGPGEIAELCRWCPPTISVITAIGPVHLERFGSLERIVEAKSEIVGGARAVVLNVDDAMLAALAERLEGAGTRVVRAGSESPSADVRVSRVGERLRVFVRGAELGGEVEVGPGVRATNLACAVAVAVELGVACQQLTPRLSSLPAVPNRLTAGRAPSGVLVLDDTYNANPAGTRVALGALGDLAGTGRRVVVTPGMVELGPRQAEENERFAAAAARVATDLVIVGRTNRPALIRGWNSVSGHGPLEFAETREGAVAWVRGHLGQGDSVLYENDLPDHYP